MVATLARTWAVAIYRALATVASVCPEICNTRYCNSLGYDVDLKNSHFLDLHIPDRSLSLSGISRSETFSTDSSHTILVGKPSESLSYTFPDRHLFRVRDGYLRSPRCAPVGGCGTKLDRDSGCLPAFRLPFLPRSLLTGVTFCDYYRR